MFSFLSIFSVITVDCVLIAVGARIFWVTSPGRGLITKKNFRPHEEQRTVPLSNVAAGSPCQGRGATEVPQ